MTRATGGLGLAAALATSVSCAQACGHHDEPIPTPPITDADADERAESSPDGSVDADVNPVDGLEADSSLVDAGRDAETPPFVGAWTHIPGAPAECTNLAVDPSVSAPALAWVPCPSGRTGCQRLVPDWGGDIFGGLFYLREEPTRLVGGKPYFTHVRLWPGRAGAARWGIAVAQALDQPASVAIKIDYGKGCAAEAYVGEFGVALRGGLFSGDTSFISWAPWSSPSDYTTLAGPQGAFGIATTGVLQGIAVGAGAIFIEETHPDRMHVLSMATKSVSAATAPGAYLYGVHGGAFAGDVDATTGVLFMQEDGAFTVPVRPESGRAATALAIDRSDGDRLVWAESDDNFSFANATLWTSPYATTPGALVRQKLGKLGESPPLGGSAMVANAGVVLNKITPLTLRITRISDGLGWTIDCEPSDKVVQPLWIDDAEAWFVTTPRSAPGFAYPTGITRIRRDTLGAAGL